MKARGAYLLPDPLEPDDYYLMCVYVPKAFDHLLAFWASLDYLAKWVAWEQNEAHDGVLAAHAWQVANEMTRTAFEEGNCDVTEPYKHRVNPGKWWVQQENSGEGGAWVDVLIQPLPCGCDEESTTAIGNPGVPNGSDIAAAILRNWYMFWIQRMTTDIGLGLTRAQFEADATALLAGYNPSAGVIDALGDGYDIASGLSGATRTAMGTAECNWQQQHRCFQKSISAWGVEWLNHLGELFACTLNALSTALHDTLNAAASMMGGTFTEYVYDKGVPAGAGGGTSFGETGGCDWIVLSLGQMELITGPTGIKGCEAWEFDCPTGYRLAGVWIEYTTNGNDSNTSPKINFSIDPNCGAGAPNRNAWGATSAWLGQGYAKGYMRITALTTTQIFTNNGFDLTGAQPSGNYEPVYSASIHLGPAHFIASLTASPTTTVGVSILANAWAVLQKFP